MLCIISQLSTNKEDVIMFYFMIAMTSICVLNIFIMLFIVCMLFKDIIGDIGTTGDK